ncbi:DUF5959 family protein [Streptomyces mirabilis]|uniref:DUF5959 family protein n=1 Tax=Streptomyces mirabilis TaxID=68239 RepID=UPI0036DF7294
MEVVVRDGAVSLTTVCVLVRLPDDWVDAQRLRLAQVRTAWPFGQGGGQEALGWEWRPHGR